MSFERTFSPKLISIKRRASGNLNFTEENELPKIHDLTINTNRLRVPINV